MTKRTYKFMLTFSLMLILLSITVSAYPNQVYHLKLLAVQEDGQGNYTGSDADLYLELKPQGSGRVFLDTYPLTKIDTQVSTRFAKEIACKHYNLDCQKYDFIYTIKAKSSIIGGPSAGAAIASLTAIAMMGLDYDENIAVTGTINSGATIGPVGGLKEKLEAASKANLKRVLLPAGTAHQRVSEISLSREIENSESIINDNKTDKESINESINIATNKTSIINDNYSPHPQNFSQTLQEYGTKNLSLQVIEVRDLDQAVGILTGTEVYQKDKEVFENQEYQKIMRNLQQVLCARGEEISKEISSLNLVLTPEVKQKVEERNNQSLQALEKQDYYSAASYCFGNNILLKTEYYKLNKKKIDVVNTLLSSLSSKSDELDKILAEKEIKTISDLQTLMIVKERVNEVRQQIKLYEENKQNTSLEEAYAILAYSEERFYSALSWMQFFTMDGKKFVINDKEMEAACLQKISEAEERNQYVSIYFGDDFIKDIWTEINLAQQAYEQKDMELCLVQALQAKAQADAILSSMGLDEESTEAFIDAKISAVEKVIAVNSEERVFPILGYSYYRYAKSLREQDKYMSLVYLEYALEMSDLEIYFSPQEQNDGYNDNSLDGWWKADPRWEGVIIGIIIGVALTLLVVFFRNKKKSD